MCWLWWDICSEARMFTDQFGCFAEQAITLCPKVPVYWTNRALCHRKRK
jgi:hypothetical protein